MPATPSENSAPPQPRETIVFLLGAGCSYDCGAPLMRDFMRTARAYRRDRCLFPDDYDNSSKFRRQCLGISYIFDRWWENIEDLFTQAEIRATIDGDRKWRDSFANVIWDVYRRVRTSDQPTGYDGLSVYLWGLAHQWATGGPRPVVVTTNYDVHLEASLRRTLTATPQINGASSTVVYPSLSTGEITTGFRTLDREPQTGDCDPPCWPVEIIKLHGSVNWLAAASATQYYCDFDRCPAMADPTKPILECQTRAFAANLAQGAIGQPWIVPPLLGKIPGDPLDDLLLKRAQASLRAAREIVVMGYSFPDTDAFMPRFLAEGLRENESLERMFIVSPRATATLKPRVERLFSRSWNQNSVRWIDSNFSKAAWALARSDPGGHAIVQAVRTDTDLSARLDQLK